MGWRSEPAKQNDEKALDCKDAVAELNETVGELYKSRFDMTLTNYNNLLDVYQHKIEMYQLGVENLEVRGRLGSTTYYGYMVKVEEARIGKMNEELKELTTKMSNAVNDGAVKKWSEAWYEMQTEINAVKEAIAQANNNVIEFNNSIRQIKWDNFDYAIDRMSQLNDESEFLIKLMEDSDLYGERGAFTNTGVATLGLRAQNYNTYINEAERIRRQIYGGSGVTAGEELNALIKNDPYNTTLLERRQELLEQQREFILNAEDEKEAIRSLVEEGIKVELDYMNDLINKYKESIDEAKSLYDYQKKVKEQTADITGIQKQISAYIGDDSEETRATIQKLTEKLKDNTEKLQDTQRDRSISEQKEMLSNLYDQYSEVLNSRLDNVDALISDMIKIVNANATTVNTHVDGVKGSVNENIASISNVLKAEAKSVGYTISSEFASVWGTGGPGDVVKTYSNIIGKEATKVNNTLNSIASNVAAMAKNSNTNATNANKSITSTTNTNTTKKFASGGVVDYTGIAQVDGTPSKPEAFLNPEDTRNFSVLKDTLRSIADGKVRFSGSGLSPVASLAGGLTGTLPKGISSNSIGDIIYQINIPIDHVSDYNDLVNKMRTDNQFEKMIQSMTLDQLAGQSSLAKNKYKW